MIEKLRRKIIIIAMCSTFIVLAVIVLFINLFNYAQINRQTDMLLELLTENDGRFPNIDKRMEDYNMEPHGITVETPFSTRFFTVSADENNSIITVNTGKVAATTTDQASQYAQKILKKGEKTGFMGFYKYSVVPKDYGNLIVFIDCRRDIETITAFIKNSMLISAGGLLSVFILVLILSKKAVEPVAQSYEKQKRFITDAGHELKTPIAIIAANTEVLEMDYGESQWTSSIYNQTKRMTELTTSLMELARMEEDNNSMQMIDFSMSDAVVESVEPFIALANSKDKEIHMNIDKDISFRGNEQSIRQLVSILLDNSIKYSPEKGKIEVALKKQGRHIQLSTCNSGKDLTQKNLDLLFDRFYRADSSRNSQTGGYGIGLSIAKGIVTKHKGKIKAESCQPDLIRITAIF